MAHQDAAPEVPPGQPSAQPPPGWPYGDPEPQPARGASSHATSSAPHPEATQRRVSRKAWYLIGTGLIALGFVLMLVLIGVAVTSGLRVFSGAIDVAVPGSSQVDLPPGEEKMVWARPGDSRSCTTTDTSGRDLPLEPSGSVTVSINDDEWVGVGTFSTGNGHVILDCDGPPGAIRVANVFNTWGLVGSILGAVLAPFVFGAAGAAVLAVTGVRHYRSR
ncbi:hypothetical protein ISU10_19530 [Nocardioides agariphilus]|jgi:hypothetical protein|uniref:Uncharacterized protein n=1 Tax=Nocardioides agariphilus TaxID=433664 RepID=A0A930VM07_9ACTN|nr:hypothetical protein [Nocardioides agariphilus]MBF4769969.1 hypothetical protein [Nocardioides agariphilus]